MKRSKHFVLIYVDTKRRDLFPALKIENILMEAGISAKAVGQFQFLAAIEFYKPTIIIYGKHDGFHGDWLRAISGGFVFSLSTEQGYSNEDVMRQVFLIGHEYINEPAHEKIDCFLTYNKITADWINRNLPFSHAEPVGSPRLYTNRLHLEARKFTKKKLTVGIISGFDVISGDRPDDFYTHYEKHNFPDFGGAQEFLSYHLIEGILLRQLASNLTSHKEIGNIILRARYDNSNEYLNKFKKYNFQIDESDDPQYFFSKVDMVIFSQSLLGLEAMMCGIPAVSFSPMINIHKTFDRVIFRNYVKVAHKVPSFLELDKIIKLRAKNRLALASDVPQFIKVAKDCFFNQTLDDNFGNRIVELVSKVDNYNIASVDVGRILCHALTPRPAKLLLLITKKFRLSYIIGVKFLKFFYRKRSEIYFG